MVSRDAERSVWEEVAAVGRVHDRGGVVRTVIRDGWRITDRRRESSAS
jgi:hypothetical protein